MDWSCRCIDCACFDCHLSSRTYTDSKWRIMRLIHPHPVCTVPAIRAGSKTGEGTPAILGRLPNPDKPELNIEDVWYRSPCLFNLNQ